MPPANRHNPTRTACSDSQFSLMEFMREYPNDAACLEHLWRERFSPDGEHADCPKCEREGVTFRRYATGQSRQSWTCTACGHHVHPTAGTIFHGSSTSLHLWFYAMYLMASTRCGISAKHLERELGVAYRTAWRMLNLIRTELMAQSDEPLAGEVEADETHWGGKPRQGEIARIAREEGRDLSSAGGTWKHRKKKTVFAMVERGGRVRASVVPSRGRGTLHGEIVEHILPGSTVFTDDWSPYIGIDGHGYRHRRIRHSEKIYVSGAVHTQTIEGFFSNLKRGVAGTYHSVSSRWLPSYLNEYAWRYNERHNPRAMFRSLVDRAAA
jgi:transposase